MKQFLLLFSVGVLMVSQCKAENFNITISETSYSPATLNVNVGDVVTIEASDFHPLVQVSQSTWNAGGSAALSGGFSSTTNFNLTITAAMAGITIFYVCSNHVSSGMKGQINVNVLSGITENKVQDFNFTLYPNPVLSDALLNISAKKAGRISFMIYDMNGKRITRFADMQMQQGEITLPFDASSLQKGTYILQMRSSQGIMRKRILIQ